MRHIWTKICRLEILQDGMPRDILPSPTLVEVLHPYHVSTTPGLNSRPHFITHNHIGQPRVCLPTIATFPNSHVYRPRANGEPGEGQQWDSITHTWEEPTLAKKIRAAWLHDGGVGNRPPVCCTLGTSYGWEHIAMAGIVPPRVPQPSMRYKPHQGHRRYILGGWASP